jgi:virulence factor Mce-like protein
VRIIRKYALNVSAIIGLAVIALLVGGYILKNQRFTLPSAVPFLGSEFVNYKATLPTAQSITPGQGQTVNVAGVPVGELSKVDLVDGRAVVTMKIRKKFTPIYRDATAVVRPKTGLNDMIIELSPGSKTKGELPTSAPIPVDQSLSPVNLDEILAGLDGDTRSYLQLLLGAGGQALDGNGRALSNTFRRFEPTSSALERITSKLEDRRGNIRRTISNFRELSESLAGKDDDLVALVDSSERVFRSFAAQDTRLREAIRELPVDADGHEHEPRQGRPPRGPARPGPRAPAAHRPGAGSVAARDPPVPAQDHPDHPEAAAPVLARRAADGPPPAPGRPRPGRAHAGPDEDVLRGQHPAQHARLRRPEGQAGVLPLLVRLGQPPRQLRLRPGRRARPDPQGHRADLVLEPADARVDQEGQPAARHPGQPARRPAQQRGLPAVHGPRGDRPDRGHRSAGRGAVAARPLPDRGPPGRCRLMQKQAPTFARLFIMVSFALSCFGLLLFLWLAFGGAVPLQPKGYRMHTSFAEATQLSKEADVRISGVSVGKVKDIVTEPGTGRSDATIELEARYAPLPKDSRATLRQKTLLGETYVELTPGSPRAGFVPEDGKLGQAQVSPTVELDEIFRAFDPKTRRDFQTWMQELAVATKGRGNDLNDTLGNLSPFAEDTNELLKILNAQKGTVQALSANTGEVFAALSEQRGQLSSLITNSNRVFDVTARRNEELQETFVALPTFQKEATATVNRLTAFSRKANPLVTQLRPAARQLSPTLTDLSALAPDLKALFRDLDPLIAASRRGLPATEKVLDELRPALAAVDPRARAAQPDPHVRRAVQGRAELLLRQHGRRDPGADRRRRRALPAHDEPTEPREPRALRPAAGLQPRQPVPAAPRVPGPQGRAEGVRRAYLRARQRPERHPEGHGHDAAGRRRREDHRRHRLRRRRAEHPDDRAAVRAAGQVRLRRGAHAVPARQPGPRRLEPERQQVVPLDPGATAPGLSDTGARCPGSSPR